MYGNKLDMRGATKITLEYTVDHQGNSGWRIQGNDILNIATSGDLIAHDIVEHVNGIEAIGTRGDELMALGAMWHVRGKYGDITRDPNRYSYTPFETLVADLHREWLDYVAGSYDFGIPLAHLKRRNIDDEELPVIKDALDEVRGTILNEAKEEPDWDMDELEPFLDMALTLICEGYYRSEQKGDGKERNELFWAIHNELQGKLQYGDYGDVIYLSYKKNGDVRATMPDCEFN